MNARAITPRGLAALLALALPATGCASHQRPELTPVSTATPSPTASVQPQAAQQMPAGHEHHMGMAMPITIPQGAIFTEADVRFMQGMIAHHAQAIYMSRMAAAHGAGPRLLRFAQKIDQSQAAEIRLMQDWLHANGQTAPDTSSWRTMTMPGMLTTAQLQQLDGAQGEQFDRLFLEFMIQHHQGALMMVDELFSTPLAAQDVDVSVFANDVQIVQTAEIGIMRQMLAEL
jgi:uncharacterized protein (DUF305 family)